MYVTEMCKYDGVRKLSPFRDILRSLAEHLPAVRKKKSHYCGNSLKPTVVISRPIKSQKCEHTKNT